MGKRVGFAAALLAATAASPAAAVVQADGDVALYWNQVAQANVTVIPANGGPVVTSRTLAMVSVAIREAVNASLGKPQYSYLGLGPASGADTRAAASVAAHNLLVQLNPANAGVYDAALTASLSQVPDGAAKGNGLLLGQSVATAMSARRMNDGWNATSNYVPTGQIGHWEPTPPANAAGAFPQWGAVDTWVTKSGDQFRPTSGPPALDSDAYAAAFNEVKQFGAGMLAPDDDRLLAAQFWASAGTGGVQNWMRVGLSLAENKGYDTLKNANIFALLTTTVADATIGIFDSKYSFDFWRPVTAIHKADQDGNPNTDVDATWSSAITTPNHPSFLSGHSAQSGSAAAVLAYEFGDNTAFCITSGTQRCWSSFTEASNEVANARLWGGIHWRFDNDAGLELGRAIAAFNINAQLFSPTPEPATWAMMIGGFALVGLATRRQRKVRVAYLRG